MAIKVFRPKDENLIAFATSSNTEGLEILRERFLNKARMLARLENAVHVLNVLEFGELSDGAPYYVMPYLPHSLADELAKGVFDTKGLVHRDIKPANVMLAEDGDVRIVDFRIAKVPDGQQITVSHLGMGSRNYRAPEQRGSAKNLDARADVYAAERVIYHTLTGKLPVSRYAYPNVVVPASGSALNEVILAALSEDREERPTDAAELLERSQQAKASAGQQASERALA